MVVFSGLTNQQLAHYNPKCDSNHAICNRGYSIAIRIASELAISRGDRPGGGFKPGGFPDLGLSFLFCPSFSVLPFLSFLFCPSFSILFLSFLFFGTFSIFPRLDFPDSSFFALCAYQKEHFRKGPRHNRDLSRKGGKPPSLETPQLSFSQ